MFVFCFQELLVILSLIIVVTPLAPKIRIMTATALTVLRALKEPGGTLPVIPPTWTVCIITDNTRQGLMVSTGITGKVITTPPRELRWKSDQWTFKNPLSVVFSFTCWSRQTSAWKINVSDWVIKISEKWGLLSFVVTIFSLFIFHFELLSLFCLLSFLLLS